MIGVHHNRCIGIVRNGIPMLLKRNRPDTTVGLHPERGTALPMCHPPGSKGKKEWRR
jgi:hypothetical protein